MTYRALDQHSVLDYVLGIPGLAARFPDPARVVTREIGDGNLNLVFVLDDEDGNAIIVKQALPYLRVAGESWPLTRDRMRFETLALRLYGDQVGDLVPEVLHADDALSLVAMEFLSDHRVLREALTQGATPTGLSDAIGRFMATTHVLNSDLHLEGEEKKARQLEFTNPHLCRLQEDFVFTNPFMESPENDSSGLPDAWVADLRADPGLKAAVLRTKIDYLSHAQTLLHGDLHTGSIMVSDSDTRVIDPEFAFYGPAAYDVGTYFAHLAIAAAAAPFHAKNRADATARQAYAVSAIRDTWDAYRRVSQRLWTTSDARGIAPEPFWQVDERDEFERAWLETYLGEIGRSAVRHAGCEVLRRLLGIVTTSELASIDDLNTRQAIEVRLARMARRWLVADDRTVSIDWLISLLAGSLDESLDT